MLRMVNFRDSSWTSEANWGLQKDMEDRLLLFPLIDPLALGLAMEADVAAGRIHRQGELTTRMHDTLEDCMLEIEELKT